MKLVYKDVFANERRHRFQMADSPACMVCGQIESVEHQLFSCVNAQRFWGMYSRITGQNISSLLDIILSSSDIGTEIVKSVFIKALIQIDRSQNAVESVIRAECRYFLNIEARVNESRAGRLREMIAMLNLRRRYLKV